MKMSKTKRKSKLPTERKPRKRTYYSLHWRINQRECGVSGALTEMLAQAMTALGRGADLVTIMKCQSES